MVATVSLTYFLLLKITRIGTKRVSVLSALIATLWLFTSSPPLYEVLLNSTTRNVEIPLALLGVYYLINRLRSEDRLQKSSIFYFMLMAIAAGVLAFHDMFLIYFVLLPLFTLQAWLFLTQTSRQAGIRAFYGALVLIGAMVVKSGIAIAASALHVYTTRDASSASFIDLATIATTLSQTFRSILAILAMDVSGVRLISPETALVVITALPLIITATSFRWSRQKSLSLSFGSYTLLALLFNIIGLSTIDYAGSTPVRYFVVLCFLIAICLVIALRTLSRTKQLIILGIVIALGIVNLGLLGLRFRSVQSLRSELPYTDYAVINHQNAPSYQVIADLEKEGVTKGYADYWQSNLLQYLSNDTMAVDSLGCAQSRQARSFDLWRVKNSPASKSSRSFLLIDKHVPSYINDDCLHEDGTLTQFGEPYKKINENNDTSIWLYNYDIGTKLSS